MVVGGVLFLDINGDGKQIFYCMEEGVLLPTYSTLTNTMCSSIKLPTVLEVKPTSPTTL